MGGYSYRCSALSPDVERKPHIYLLIPSCAPSLPRGCSYQIPNPGANGRITLYCPDFSQASRPTRRPSSRCCTWQRSLPYSGLDITQLRRWNCSTWLPNGQLTFILHAFLQRHFFFFVVVVDCVRLLEIKHNVVQPMQDKSAEQQQKRMKASSLLSADVSLSIGLYDN